MRLKQLKLAGFKSFANPITFHFPKTITAIVGPNGCGKSNVIDAIRWVLGESSAKQLRGGAMSDVIFAGTQDKFAKSLASVELVFEHTQGEDGKSGIYHALNLYHELSVRRQITKDGKSDYFINGTKVRRRDVVDVFLGTGLGARSYAVIEQGMIGRIIDANALQLREFIEEASGVSRYQSRREDTQKQLDTASDNLSRLHDMASELAIQQKRLEKQAKTAQQAQTWQQQFYTISEQILVDDYGQAWQKQQNLANDVHAMSEKLAIQQDSMAEIMEQNQTAQRHITEQQLIHQEQQNLVQRHWQQHHESQSLFSQSQQTLSNDQQRLNTLDFELKRFDDYQQDLLEQKHQAQTRIAELPQQLDDLTKQINGLRDEQYTVKQNREQIAKNLVELNKQKTDIEKQQAVSENAIKHLSSQQHRHNQRQQEHDKAMKAWEVAKANFDKEFGDMDEVDFDAKIAKIGDTIERLEARIIARQEELADQTDEVESLTRQHRQAEQQRHTWQTEQNTLQNLLEQQQNAFAKSPVTKKGENDNPLPKIISQLKLSDQGKQFATIFDTLVAVFADWGFMENDNDLEKILVEQSVIISTPSLTLPPSGREFPSLWEGLGEGYDGFVALDDLIESPTLGIFEQVWLNREPWDLADFDITKLLSTLPNQHWLLLQTIENEMVLVNHQYLLNLSKSLQHQGQTLANFSQQFAHEARIDELTELLSKQKPQLDRLANALQEASVSLQEWQAQDRTARNELLALTQQRQRLQQDKLQHEHRYQSAFDKIEQDKKRLDDDSKRLNEEVSGFDNSLSKEKENLTQLNQKLAQLQPQLHQQISERQKLDERLNNFATEQRELEQQQNRLTQNLATGQLQITASEQQLAKAEQDRARLENEHKQLAEKIAEQTERLPQLEQQVAEQAEKLELANITLENLGQKVKALENDFQIAQVSLQEAQHQFANLQQQSHALDTALALAKQTVELISEQFISQELALPNVENLTLLGEKHKKDLQHQLDKLKSQIGELGAVNYSAVAELDEVNSRLKPLSEQINDMTASIDKLQQAIKEIDGQTKQLFMDMLTQVNLELNNLFTQVFGGGQAQLVLSEDSEKGWQSGLELMAQPKGKKNSRLALLSGGEKTLTALSLIFAIFKQQPAPFCVLDEVDAPLDDANVERFTRLIEQLAKDVQFIFISHNKLSMQIADELKGVTMPTAGVSKLVSVDMKEIAQYLE